MIMKALTKKDEYVDEQISQKLQFWIGKITILGMILFPLFCISDYFVTPENFGRFIHYRLVVTIILATFYFCNRYKRSKTYQNYIIAGVVLTSAIVMELMILRSGAHQSGYYAGMNLIILAALGFIPFSLFLAITISVIIYAIYIIPILAIDTIINVPVFISNNMFILSTFAISLLLRILNQKSMINELSLQYDLATEQKMLENYTTVLEDVVEERTAELVKSEQWHRALSENATDGIVVTDQHGVIVSINERACKTHGYAKKDLVDADSGVLELEANRDAVTERRNRIIAGESLVFETMHKKKDGSFLSFEISSTAINIGDQLFIQSFYRDISEKKKLQEHLQQTQKMESIGALAGGIAHDFNNILSAIIGYGHLSQMKLCVDDPVRHYVDQIMQSSERATALTQSLLAFSRKQPVKKELIAVNTVIRNFEKFLHRLLREDIEMTIQYSAEQPIIMADRGQIEQVVMNLVTNARDAMPDKGRLTIDTKITAMDEAFMRFHGYGKAGNYATLSVADTGIGISEETKKRIFEPFFTTKEIGKGTGLGLATVYGIVKAHDGFINVYSEPGKGSVFHVYFPLASTTNAVLEPDAQNPVLLKGGNETILLAEDDVSLRNMTSVVLRDMGYTVIEAEDGNNAVTRFVENRAAIKLAILDGIMPKMNGLEAYQEISALSPMIHCIFMSGYAGEVFARDGLPTGTMFLSKPVKPSELLSKTREMLDRA
jgi:PAS domain S-box-containing protein